LRVTPGRGRTDGSRPAGTDAAAGMRQGTLPAGTLPAGTLPAGTLPAGMGRRWPR
jgi:hypothetical protein